MLTGSGLTGKGRDARVARMNPLDQTQPTSVLLTCQTCGRRTLYIPSNDAAPETAAPPTSCRSCGSEVAVPVALNSGGSPAQLIDEAATARIQPQVLPDSGAMSPLSEASTAILAPPTQARDNIAPPVGASAPVSEVDQYKTAAAMEPVTRTPPATWPVPESGIPASERASGPASGQRNLWILVGTILVLAVLFVGGILLAQTGNQPTESKTTPVTQPTSTSTLPAGFVQKTDANSLYTFAVPISWVEMPHQGPPSTEFTIYADPTQDTSFEVESFPTGTQAGGSALDTLILLQSFPTLRPTTISQPSSVLLAHETWVQETAKLTLAQNGATVTENLAVQTTIHNGTTFIIFYSGPSTSTSGGGSQVLLQVLSTFTFLG
jgi:hypothetical protein